MSSYSSYHSSLTPKQSSRDLDSSSDERQDEDAPPVPLKDSSSSIWSNTSSSTSSSMEQSYHHHQQQYVPYNQKHIPNPHPHQSDPNAYQSSMLPPSQQSTIRGNLSRPSSAMIEIENARDEFHDSEGLDGNREARSREDSSSTSPDNFFSPRMWPSSGPAFASSFESNHHSMEPDYDATTTSHSRRHRPSLPDQFVDAEQSQPQNSFPNHFHGLSASDEDANKLSAGGIFGSSSIRSRASSNGQVRSRTTSQASSRSRNGGESILPSPSPSLASGYGLNVTTSDLPDPSTFPLPPNSNPSSAQVSPSTSKSSHQQYSSDTSLRNSGSTRGSTWTERSLASSRTSASAISDKSVNSPSRPLMRSSSTDDRSGGESEGYGDGDGGNEDASADSEERIASTDVDAVGLGISSDKEEAYGVVRSRTVTAGSQASEASPAARFEGPFAHHRQPSWTTRRADGGTNSMVFSSSNPIEHSQSSVQIERPTLARLQSEMTLDTYHQQQQQFKAPQPSRERNASVGSESMFSESNSNQGHGGVFIPPRTGSRSRTISDARKSSTRSNKAVTSPSSPTLGEVAAGIERIQSPSRSSSLKKPSKKSSSSKIKSQDGSPSTRPGLNISAGLKSRTSSPSLSSPTSPDSSASRARGRAESLSTVGSAFDVLLSSDAALSPSSELDQEEVMASSSPQLQSHPQSVSQGTRRRANTREGSAHPLSIDTTQSDDKVGNRSRNASISSVGESMLSYRKSSTATSSSASSRNGSGGNAPVRRGGTVRSRGDSVSGSNSFMLPPSSDYSYDDEDADRYSGSHFGYVESYIDANPDESDDAVAVKTVLDGTGIVVEANGRHLSEVGRDVGSETTHLVLGGCQSSSEMPFFLERTLPLISQSLLALDLSNTGLRTVPSAISLCNSLEELNLSSNPFQFSSSNTKKGDQTLPSWLGTLPSLRVLVIDDLNIECLPKSFQDLKELKTLSIRKNQFTHLPSWLHHCSKLERICLDENKFQGAWIKILAPLLPVLPTAQGQQHQSRFTGGSLSAPSNNTTFDPQHAPPVPGHQGNASEEQLSLPASASSGSNGYSGWAESIGRGGLRPLMRRMQSSGDLKNGKTQAVGSGGNDEMRAPGGMTRSSASYNDALSQAQDQDSHRPMPDFSRQSSASQNASGLDLTGSNQAQGHEDAGDSKWGFLRKKMGRKSSSNRMFAMASESGKSSGTEGKNSRPTSRAGPGRGAPAESYSSLSNSSSVASNLSSMDGGGLGSAPLTPISPNHGFPEPQSSASSLSTAGGGLQGFADRQRKRRSFLPIQTNMPLSANSVESTLPAEVQDPEIHQRRLRALLHYLRDLDDLGPSLANSRNGPAGFDPPSPNDSPAALRRQQSFGALLASNPLKNGLAALSNSKDSSVGNSSGVESSARSTASRSSAGQGSQAGSSNFNSPITTPNCGSNDSHLSSPSAAIQPNLIEYKDNSNRRRLILLEMLSSEESYIKGLNELVEIYTRPAMLPLETGDSKPAIPASEHRAVYSNVEGLQKFHKDAFLPSLRQAVQPLIARQNEQIGGESNPEEDAAFTAKVAEEVATVFIRHAAFFRMYSSYINNCDSAQTRIQSWLLPSVSAAASAFKSNSSSASNSAAGDTVGGLTSSQRKRIKLFMKKCRAHPRHSQLNVESYLLLPVQRLPRYRLLLEDLVKSTPPFRLKDPEVASSALDNISKICSSVNESKRQSEQDRRLLHWQSRIRGRWPSPLVQPHRRLVKDGTLTLKRVVKRVPAFLAEQSASADDDDEDEDPSDSNPKPRKKVPVDCLQQQSLDLNLVLILCNDLTVTVQDSSNGRDENAPVDLYAVLRVQASKPVQVIGGTNLRVCDSRSILYFSARSPAEAEAWAVAINSQNQD